MLRDVRRHLFHVSGEDIDDAGGHVARRDAFAPHDRGARILLSRDRNDGVPAGDAREDRRDETEQRRTIRRHQGSVGTINNTATITSSGTFDAVTGNNTNAASLVMKGGTGKKK
jgi:hypothetical protein